MHGNSITKKQKIRPESRNFCLRYLVLIKKERSKSVSLPPFDEVSIYLFCEEKMKIHGQNGVFSKSAGS
jgi:hypothetical protein